MQDKHSTYAIIAWLVVPIAALILFSEAVSFLTGKNPTISGEAAIRAGEAKEAEFAALQDRCEATFGKNAQAKWAESLANKNMDLWLKNADLIRENFRLMQELERRSSVNR